MKLSQAKSTVTDFIELTFPRTGEAIPLNFGMLSQKIILLNEEYVQSKRDYLLIFDRDKFLTSCKDFYIAGDLQSASVLIDFNKVPKDPHLDLELIESDNYDLEYSNLNHIEILQIVFNDIRSCRNKWLSTLQRPVSIPLIMPYVQADLADDPGMFKLIISNNIELAIDVHYREYQSLLKQVEYQSGIKLLLDKHIQFQYALQRAWLSGKLQYVNYDQITNVNYLLN